MIAFILNQISSLLLPDAYTAEASALRPMIWSDGLEDVLQTEVSWIQIPVLPFITLDFPPA